MAPMGDEPMGDEDDSQARPRGVYWLPNLLTTGALFAGFYAVVAAIDEVLKPRGVAVMVEAEHTCMSLRGVEKHGSSTVTTQFTGLFREDPSQQVRFISLVRER